MRDLTAEERAILDSHSAWRRGDYGGERADLSGADLSGAYFRDANLREIAGEEGQP